MSDNSPTNGQHLLLRQIVESLLADLRNGVGDRDKRRHVEEWLKGMPEKHPDFGVEEGLREFYLAEASRLRAEFEAARDLTERLNLGRSVEIYLDKAADYERRIRERS